MPEPSASTIGVFNRGLKRLPFLSAFLDGQSVPVLLIAPSRLDATVGWGRRKYARRARRVAAARGLPFACAEDGFLRSYGTGAHFPPLSLVIDYQGMYYDSTCPSDLESLLNSGQDMLAGIADAVLRARALIFAERLSKYNHAPLLDEAMLRPDDRERVLVIDQTAGDMSVVLGGADAHTFAAMLSAARTENPNSTVYVKTHPEVTSGRKTGYLTEVQDDARTVVLRQEINPLSLIERMDRVYTVTSTMGFEAVMAGKPVTVLGVPWYAGWGVTDDRQPCPRRTRRRSADELFAAAYFHYARYLNPVTRQRGSIFDVIDWLVRQREMAARYPGRMIGVGFRRWKASNVAALLSLDQARVIFVPDAAAARALHPDSADCLVHWGQAVPAELSRLAASRGARLLRMEDGFLRSVGLGSDLIRPLSVVLDERGIYFDPGQASDLEHVLSTAEFSSDERARARRVREFIVRNGVTKYNLEPRPPATWPSGGREVVLVPGQVEDDASIRLGCNAVRTNLGLLQAVRQVLPNAYIVYKPHPDVMSGNRVGKLALPQARELADHVETRVSVVNCIQACDAVHTMTSLAGFDALLRDKRVVVYGRPFYAGWGLTEDVATEEAGVPRRQRQLTLDELVAGTLLRYAIYWDWDLMGATTCEAVLHQLVETRNALEASGDLEKLRVGFSRRQWRKLRILVGPWGSKA